MPQAWWAEGLALHPAGVARQQWPHPTCVMRTGCISTSFTTTATSEPENPSVRRPSSSNSACGGRNVKGAAMGQGRGGGLGKGGRGGGDAPAIAIASSAAGMQPCACSSTFSQPSTPPATLVLRRCPPVPVPYRCERVGRVPQVDLKHVGARRRLGQWDVDSLVKPPPHRLV